ncbi:MAG: phytanoyl-CoA dioxygenase family protein [Bryobacteraceae bacterium]|nr:phytanoyl-CoA dioxygenase family protein [Bryobacteraceae bacterium]MDW8377314.1 phytanoyl-CoA dioxygenase family protein [Bryobacterales bacterium]
MTAADKQQLDELGFVLLKNYMTAELLEELRTAFDRQLAQEGERAGHEFKREPGARRLANLVDKAEVFRRIISDAQILEYVAAVIPGKFKLSSLNGRAPDPESEIVQPLHCDAAAIPDEKGYWVCNVIWMLDDFTAENGATRLVPGTHRSKRLPQEVLADPLAPHPEEILLTAPAGSVAVINTHAWHGATANRSQGPRRCLHAFYTRWDKPQQQFQRALLREETIRQLSPQLRELLAIDDELNARLTLADPGRSGFLK